MIRVNKIREPTKVGSQRDFIDIWLFEFHESYHLTLITLYQLGEINALVVFASNKQDFNKR